MVTCNICSKEFKSTQGLKGHKTFKHGNGSSGNGSAANSASEQQPNKILERLEQLESITGVNKESELGESSVITDNSLTQRVSQLGEQLSELTQQVNQLTGQLEHTQTTKEMLNSFKAEHNKQLEQLSNGWNNAYHKISSTANHNSELINKSFSVNEDSTKTVNKKVDEINERVGKLEGRHEPVLGEQVSDKLSMIEQKLSSFTKELGVVKNLAIRQPTGKLALVTLTDHLEHEFKEYKSPDGLTKPDRYSRDLLFGDKWIDLAEPED